MSRHVPVASVLQKLADGGHSVLTLQSSPTQVKHCRECTAQRMKETRPQTDRELVWNYVKTRSSMIYMVNVDVSEQLYYV